MRVIYRDDGSLSWQTLALILLGLLVLLAGGMFIINQSRQAKEPTSTTVIQTPAVETVPVQGAPGPAGSTGMTGATGDTGDTGDTGQTGRTGTTGTTGRTGTTGAAGAAGATGAAGAAGAAGADAPAEPEGGN